jgi:hypothetical protein
MNRIHQIIIQFIYILRAFFISVEILFLFILFGLFYYKPDLFLFFGKVINDNNNNIIYPLTFIAVILSFSVKYSWKILFPIENGSNRILREWEGYWQLKFRAILSIFWCFISLITAVILWFLNLYIERSLFGLFFIAAIGIPLIIFSCQFLAAIKLKELLEK